MSNLAPQQQSEVFFNVIRLAVLWAGTTCSLSPSPIAWRKVIVLPKFDYIDIDIWAADSHVQHWRDIKTRAEQSNATS